jgi:hypothetical protein
LFSLVRCHQRVRSLLSLLGCLDAKARH